MISPEFQEIPGNLAFPSTLKRKSHTLMRNFHASTRKNVNSEARCNTPWLRLREEHGLGSIFRGQVWARHRLAIGYMSSLRDFTTRCGKGNLWRGGLPQASQLDLSLRLLRPGQAARRHPGHARSLQLAPAQGSTPSTNWVAASALARHSTAIIMVALTTAATASALGSMPPASASVASATLAVAWCDRARFRRGTNPSDESVNTSGRTAQITYDHTRRQHSGAKYGKVTS